MTATTMAGRAGASTAYRGWFLALLGLIYMSNVVDRTVLSVLAQPIKKELGLSDTQLGLLGGVTFALFYTTLGLPIARLAERKSRLMIIAVCVTIWSAMTALSGLAQSFLQLAAARVGVGIGEAGCAPSANAMISDHYPPARRASALAVYSLGLPLGTMVGAIGGGWIAQHWSWRAAFLLAGLPGLVLAALALATLKDPRRGGADAGHVMPDEAPPLADVLRRLKGRPSALLMCAGSAVATIAGFGINAFVAAYFSRRFHLDYAQAALAAGLLAGVPTAISMLAGGFLTDVLARRDRRAYSWVAGVGAMLAAPLCAIAFFQTSLAAALAVLSVAALCQHSYIAPTYAVANNVVEPRMRATAISLLSMVWNLVGLALGPLLVGMMSDRLAARAYTAGAYLVHCPTGRAAARHAVPPACAEAAASGLQGALQIIVVFYFLGGILYLLAGRTMRRDLEPTG